MEFAQFNAISKEERTWLMRSHTLSTSTFVKAGVLSLALAAGPLSGGVFAQTTDPSRTPAESARTADARDDDGFDWGWLGLLGLIGLMGLRHREEPRTRGDANIDRPPVGRAPVYVRLGLSGPAY